MHPSEWNLVAAKPLTLLNPSLLPAPKPEVRSHKGVQRRASVQHPLHVHTLTTPSLLPAPKPEVCGHEYIQRRASVQHPLHVHTFLSCV